MCTISHHYMSVSRSVTPCPAQSFCLLSVSVCQYTCISVTLIRTMPSIYVCVCVFAPICPYIVFTAVCPCVCLSHSCILYVPFIHFYDCLSIYVSLCMSMFMYIYYMYSCMSVCLLHSCAITPIPVCASSCPFV